MRVNRNRDGESTWRRRRTVAAWLAGIAMPAFVAAQAVEDGAQGTTAAVYAEPKVEVVVQTTDNATAMTECRGADSLSEFAAEEATIESDPNAAAVASDEPGAGTDVLVLQIKASHYRNLDQTSLVFREDVVDLVTNHTGYQNGPFRLGWLRTPMSRDFESLRARIERYRTLSLNEVLMAAQKRRNLANTRCGG